MLNKVSGLARALHIILAIVAGFVVLGSLNVSLVLIVLGLISGISMTSDRYVPTAATLLVLPAAGAALGQIPAIGEQLNAVAGNIALAAAGALASAIALMAYNLVKDAVLGLTAK